ncbi:MAG: TRAP transporter small permease [Granulosicoccus sp.]|nr:TRAP transporter small permease [Granulosicoccus sp.]
MKQFYRFLVRLFSKLNLVCAILGACILFFIASISLYEVLSRAVPCSSRLWVIEVSEYSLLFITFLCAPYLLEKNKHVVLDLVYDNLGRRSKRAASLLNAFIGLFICSTLTIVGVMVSLDQYQTGIREVTVMAPLSFWLTAALPLGMFLMAFQFLDQGVRAISSEDTD